jgi:capsid protein
MQADPGTFHNLPAGVDFKGFEPQFPSNDFESFHKSILRGIASGLGVSYTSLSNDLEATSYSSIRQGALEERDFYKNITSFVIEHFIRPVFLLGFLYGNTTDFQQRQNSEVVDLAGLIHRRK